MVSILEIYSESINYTSNLINLININLGPAIFKSYSRPNENNKDPFRPAELNNQKNNNGAPPKLSANPRKLSRILKTTG